MGIRRGLCLMRQVFRHPGLDTRLAGTGLVCFEVGIQRWTCRVGAPHPREWGPGPALTEGQGGPPGPPHLLSLLTYPQVGWLRLTPEPLNPHLTCTLHLCGSRCPAPLPRSWEQSRTPSHPHPRGRAGWGQRLCSGTLSADPSCCGGRQHAPPLIHPTREPSSKAAQGAKGEHPTEASVGDRSQVPSDRGPQAACPCHTTA